MDIIECLVRKEGGAKSFLMPLTSLETVQTKVISPQHDINTLPSKSQVSNALCTVGRMV